MEPSTIYYCAQGVASIAKVAINYKNAMDVNETVGLKLDKLQFANESIKDFLDLIRNDIQSMMHMHFRSAYENLNYALHANAHNKTEYLVQARNRFIDASTIERNDNLILTYLGLAFCQELLDDLANSNITLNKIRGVHWEDIYSDNPDILLKDWDLQWWHSRFKALIYTSLGGHMPYMLLGYMTSEFLQNVPSSQRLGYLRRLNALIRCGVFSSNYSNKEAFYDICAKAEKSILQENFSSLKQDVISSFQLAD
jgi:hypothetical protein